MVADNNKITDLVEKIEYIIDMDIDNEVLSEIQDVITKSLLDIDVTLYYQLLDLYDNVHMVRKMMTKYNLLYEDVKKKDLSEKQKMEIMAFILQFARRIGNEACIYEKIEDDYGLLGGEDDDI